MNVSQIRELLKHLLTANLDSLSRKQRESLFKDLSRHALAVERETELAEWAKFQNEIPAKGEPFFKTALKQRGGLKPRMTADPADLRAYLKEMQTAWSAAQKEIAGYESILSKLAKTNGEQGLKIIDSLSDEERKNVCKLAALTKLTARGSGAWNLNKSAKNNEAWLGELQKTTGDLLGSRKR